MAYKVLVVEGNPSLQLTYKLNLRRAGFDVSTAPDGIEGLRVAGRVRPDLILTALRLPRLSGADMLTRLRSLGWGGDARIVALTEFSHAEAPQSLRFLAVDRILEKAHYTPAQVTAAVDAVLSASS